MPTPNAEDLGPLAGLVGTWEGADGLDVAFHNAKDGAWSYEQTTVVDVAKLGRVLAHTDRNTLRRVD